MKGKVNIAEELARLHALEDALLAQQAQMTPEEKIKALEEAQPRVEFGSPEHAALLASGYGMTIEQARTIVKERKEKPELWPYEEFAKAQAMLAAFEVDPKKQIPSSSRQGWHRSVAAA